MSQGSAAPLSLMHGMRNWFELLERAREGFGETPSRPRGELLDLAIEVQVVNPARQVLGDIQLTLHEGLVDNQVCIFVRKAGSFPGFDLFPHRLEVPLHAVHSDCEDVDEAQLLGALGKGGSQHA